jgi:FKBP-type peptidyl-prolyl cis-trans isomerase FklB
LQPVAFALRLGFTTMKRIRTTLVALLICSAVASYAEDAKPSPSPAENKPAATSIFKNDKDKVSYSLGVDIGRTLQRLQLDLNETALSQGIADVLGNKPMAMTDQELQQTLQAFQQKMMQKQQEAMSKKQDEMKAVAEKNKIEGKKFLEDNAKKSGVKTTASGLQYKIIKEGTGEKPKDADTVETNYRGTTIDGKEFDSSAKHGSSFSFPVNGVIKGWSEALKMMPVGSKWELYVPSDLAYGDEGYGDDIAPGSTLVFEVELLGIKKNAANTAAPGSSAQPESGTEKRPAGS